MTSATRLLRHTWLCFALALAGALPTTGCSSASDDDDSAQNEDEAGSGTGTLALTFRIDDDYAAAMDEPASGGFWGTLYYSDQVTGIGPEEGAEELGHIYVEMVDLSTDLGPSPVLFETEPLPIGYVTVLGFMDSDGNSIPDDRGPDDGDPVTLPNDNEFLVSEDSQTTVEVFFGFLNP